MAFTDLAGADVADDVGRVGADLSFPLVGKVAAKPTDGGRRAVLLLGGLPERLLQPCNSVEQILHDPHPRPLPARGRGDRQQPSGRSGPL